MAEREGSDSSGRPPRLMMAVFIVALLLIAFTSLYMVQMPGSLSIRLPVK